MKQIDIAKVIRQKYKGYLPEWLLKKVKCLIHQDEINELLTLQDHVGGVSFAGKVMKALGLGTRVYAQERLPREGRYIFVSNHPLGGADGVILTSVLGQYYDGNISFLVNDLLMNIEQFGDVFLPVNKYGRQTREHLAKIEQALASDRQIITFPAGLCSREDDSGAVRDLDWSPSIVHMARRHDRLIVPIFFDAQNSPRFYRWARLRSKLKIKFNYELILLPDELFKSKGRQYDIYIGRPFSVLNSLRSDDKATAQALRDYIYTLPTDLSASKDL